MFGCWRAPVNANPGTGPAAIPGLFCYSRGGRGDASGQAMAAEREVILEFQRIGNSVKVTAVDPETLIEVSIVGAASAGEEALRRTAVRKLEYVLGRRRPGAPKR
jgi:hypothetical protein